MSTDSTPPGPAESDEPAEPDSRALLDEILRLVDHHGLDPAALLSLSTELQSIAVDRLVARAAGRTTPR